ncbi:MAG: hypothetical protein K1060chlam1_01199 [Candidatus Anoxychlamydiales bacterium]|nr:hypothetical protein [Candidatus Anoxychlamydiales bacterium]
MKIIDSFTQLYGKDIKPMYQQCFSDLKKTQGLYLKAVEVLKTTDNALRKLIIHYPKTMLIATFVNVMFTVFLPSTFAVIRLVINGYIFIRHITHMNTAMKVYEDNKISELFSLYSEKQSCELRIAAEAFVKKF